MSSKSIELLKYWHHEVDKYPLKRNRFLSKILKTICSFVIY